MKRLHLVAILIAVSSFVSACSAAQGTKPTADDVIAAFKKAGLEAERPTKLSKEDYGAAPFVCEGSRFLVPSIGEDSGGRVFICKNQEDRESLVDYYQKLGKASALFFSWVFVKDDIVVQINGDLKEDLARKYERAIP